MQVQKHHTENLTFLFSSPFYLLNPWTTDASWKKVPHFHVASCLGTFYSISNLFLVNWEELHHQHVCSFAKAEGHTDDSKTR